jgi:hypothetical protein
LPSSSSNNACKLHLLQGAALFGVRELALLHLDLLHSPLSIASSALSTLYLYHTIGNLKLALDPVAAECGIQNV